MPGLGPGIHACLRAAGRNQPLASRSTTTAKSVPPQFHLRYLRFLRFHLPCRGQHQRGDGKQPSDAAPSTLKPRQQLRATPAAPPRQTTYCAAPTRSYATTGAVAENTAALPVETPEHARSWDRAQAHRPGHNSQPAASIGSAACGRSVAYATAAHIRCVAVRPLHSATAPDSTAPLARWQYAARRRTSRATSAATRVIDPQTDRSTESLLRAPWCQAPGQ